MVKTTQYQIKTEAPPGALLPIPQFTGWYHPWSLPVRYALPKRMAITLDVASGPVTPPPQPVDLYGIAWFEPLSEPQRQKIGLKAQLQRVNALETPVQPDTSQFIQWFARLSEPVRQKIGLKTQLQRSWAGPDRLIPPADVTMTLAVAEIDTDVFLGAINVYNSATPATPGAGARVTIIEVASSGGDPVSISES